VFSERSIHKSGGSFTGFGSRLTPAPNPFSNAALFERGYGYAYHLFADISTLKIAAT
jgi:hypothetical protein